MEEAIYKAVDLCRRYGNRVVIDIPRLRIESGAVHALLGPNGAGKSTLLNILAFLDAPSSGELTFRSKRVRYSAAYLQRLRRQVVLVEQHPIMFSTTVWKNVEFGLKMRKIAKSERRKMVAEALDLVGMGGFAKAPANSLSGGETQRVALARGLAVEPAVFLCDEPTSSVDVENQSAILRILRRINRQRNITVVFATHDLLQADLIAHHTVRLDRGRLTRARQDNVFAAVLHSDNGHGVTCRIDDSLSLQLANTAVKDLHIPPGGRVRVLIDPTRLSVRPATVNEADDPQELSGQIVLLAKENGNVRTVVDVGVRLNLIQTGEQYRQHPLPVGQSVRVSGTELALRVLPG